MNMQTDRSEQLRRIGHFETMLRDMEQALRSEEIPEDRFADLRTGFRELSEYYGSVQWKQDLADDEAGLLPRELPRGVLSEDGIYNALERYREWNSDSILKEICCLQDEGYASFQAKLIPNIDPARILGVRTPDLRALARRLKEERDTFCYLGTLPHTYFEEDQLHAFILSGEKSFAVCMEQLERFLPYVDNWATCDQLSPRVFRKHKEELLPHIRKWVRSEETYTIRFGIGMLMRHYLDEHFDPEHPAMAAQIRSGEYYVNMMTAWYFATALAKQYESVIPYMENEKLDVWTHNKTIQKCMESRRIPPERKEYLKTLKRRTGQDGSVR